MDSSLRSGRALLTLHWGVAAALYNVAPLQAVGGSLESTLLRCSRRLALLLHRNQRGCQTCHHGAAIQWSRRGFMPLRLLAAHGNHSPRAGGDGRHRDVLVACRCGGHGDCLP